MSEQARIENAVEMTIDNCEVLRARLAKYEDADGKPITTLAEQAREIERLKEGREKLIFTRDDYKKQAHDYRARWASAISSGNAPVGAIEAVIAEFPLFDDAGLDQEAHHCEWSVQHDRKRLHALLSRLNQPASAGDGRAGWTEQKPTEEGAYWIRGNGLEANALVQVKQEEDELWCNLHMRNSEPVFEYGYTIEQLSSEFEWLGPLQARAALSANHSEQVREWVPVSERLPETKVGTEADFIVAIRRAHNGKTYVVPASFLNRFELYSEDEAADDEGRIYVTGWYREMADDEYDTAWHKMETEGDLITHWQELPAAPSAGSHGGDV